MNNVSKAVLFSLFSAVAFSATASEMSTMHAAAPTAQQEQTVQATGEVKLIDLDAKKITIAHGPVAALNWPAMTMRFTFTQASQIQGITAGDQVKFTFIQQGNISLLQDIRRQH